MLQTFINGVPYLMTDDFKISDMVGNKSTTDISVLVENQPIPRAGDIVEIKDVHGKSNITFSGNGTANRILSSNKWGTPGRCWILTIPEGAKYIYLKANVSQPCQYAFLTATTHTANTVPKYVAGTQRMQVTAGNEATVEIPSGAVYLYIDKQYSESTVYTPSVATYLAGLDMTIFWGILGIPKSPKYTTGNEWRVYKMAAGNGNSLLAYRVINEAFRNYTVSEIVQALYTNYIAEEGIALGEISDIEIKVKIYSAADFNLQDALNELAELCGAAWTITADRKFYFTVQEEFNAFPVVIDKTALPISEFQHTTKAYKQRTIQYISGATNTTIPQTETFTYTGDTGTGFELSFGVNERPTITINDEPVEPSRIGVAGLDYADPDIWFTFAYNSKTISYNSQSAALETGDTVSITYIGIYSIRIAAENTRKINEISALTGTSGKREIVTSLTGVRSQEDAVAAANSLLEKFEDATEEITFWLESGELYELGLDLNSLNVMTKVTINIPEWGADGDYIVAERHISALEGDLTEDAEKKLKIQLRLVNRDYMKTYGEVLADLKKNVRSLNIRDDEIIVKAYSTIENQAFAEDMVIYTLYPNFPVPSASGADLFAMTTFDGIQYPA